VIVVPDTDRLIALAERQGQPLTEGFALDAIRREIASLNASEPLYKRISSFLLRQGEFPKTTTRKIRRSEALREAGMVEARPHRVAGAG
jgi:long-chain acyl-CoA synthetase